MKQMNPKILGGRKSLYAMGILGICVLAGSAIAFFHPVHADSSTAGSVGDPDQGAACSGSGDNQQGDCGLQSGDQTGPDVNSAHDILD
jgi:hypothetical protein